MKGCDRNRTGHLHHGGGVTGVHHQSANLTRDNQSPVTSGMTVPTSQVQSKCRTSVQVASHGMRSLAPPPPHPKPFSSKGLRACGYSPHAIRWFGLLRGRHYATMLHAKPYRLDISQTCQALPKPSRVLVSHPTPVRNNHLRCPPPTHRVSLQGLHPRQSFRVSNRSQSVKPYTKGDRSEQIVSLGGTEH